MVVFWVFWVFWSLPLYCDFTLDERRTACRRPVVGDSGLQFKGVSAFFAAAVMSI
jgi:hypothetical protein